MSTSLVSLLPDIDRALKGYPADKAVEAAAKFIVTGSVNKTAELSDIPRRTLRSWMETAWWPPLVDTLRKEKQDELDAQLTSIIHTTVGHLQKTLTEGEPYTNKRGEVKYKPVGARDLAHIFSILYDKRAMQRGELRTVSVDTTSQLETMRAEFENLSRQMNESLVREGRVINIIQSKDEES